MVFQWAKIEKGVLRIPKKGTCKSDFCSKTHSKLKYFTANESVLPFQSIIIHTVRITIIWIRIMPIWWERAMVDSIVGVLLMNDASIPNEIAFWSKTDEVSHHARGFSRNKN